MIMRDKYATPHRCSGCGGSWFKIEEHMRLAKSARPVPEGGNIPTYYEPGEQSFKMVYVCTACNTILKEPYIKK